MAFELGMVNEVLIIHDKLLNVHPYAYVWKDKVFVMIYHVKCYIYLGFVDTNI